MPEYATKEELESKADLDEGGKLDPEQVPLAVVTDSRATSGEPGDLLVAGADGYERRDPAPTYGEAQSPDALSPLALRTSAAIAAGTTLILGSAPFPLQVAQAEISMLQAFAVDTANYWTVSIVRIRGPVQTVALRGSSAIKAFETGVARRLEGAWDEQSRTQRPPIVFAKRDLIAVNFSKIGEPVEIAIGCHVGARLERV